MTAVGDAKARAQGQEITITVIANRRAKAKGAEVTTTPVEARTYQTMKQVTDRRMMMWMNLEAMRSTYRCRVGFVDCVVSMSL